MHTNKSNGKKYIGITSQNPPEKRWMAGHGYSEKLPIGRAVRKYGWDGFTHEILLDNLSEEQAKNMEVFLIDYYHTQDDQFGYNITAGGDGVTGMHHSELSKQKMSEAKSGDKHPNFGKHLSEATKAKIGAAHIGNTYSLGLTRSKETREKMSASKMKPVAMCNTDGETLRIFDSAKTAGEVLGINRKNISLCCKNQRHSAGGYAWKFA